MTEDNAADTFFPCTSYWENIKAFVCFLLHVVWRPVTKAPLAGNSFENEAKNEASQRGLI